MIRIIGSIIWIIGFIAMIVAVASEKEKAKGLSFIIGILFLVGASYTSGLGNTDDPDQGLLYHIESDPVIKENIVYLIMTNVNTTAFYSRPVSLVIPTLKKGDWATYENRIIKKVNQT